MAAPTSSGKKAPEQKPGKGNTGGSTKRAAVNMTRKPPTRTVKVAPKKVSGTSTAGSTRKVIASDIREDASTTMQSGTSMIPNFPVKKGLKKNAKVAKNTFKPIPLTK